MTNHPNRKKTYLAYSNRNYLVRGANVHNDPKAGFVSYNTKKEAVDYATAEEREGWSAIVMDQAETIVWPNKICGQKF